MDCSVRRLDTALGALRLEACDSGISGLRLWKAGDREYGHGHDELLGEAGRQLEAYIQRERTRFDLPIAPSGTDFERRVWRQLTTVPYGEAVSYASIAREIGRENACRAVGRACGRNPVLILIPCHRIVASSGALTGFAAGLEMKRALLELEGHTVIRESRIRLRDARK